MSSEMLKKISALNLDPVGPGSGESEDIEIKVEDQDTLSFENMSAAKFQAEMDRIRQEQETKQTPEPSKSEKRLPSLKKLSFSAMLGRSEKRNVMPSGEDTAQQAAETAIQSAVPTAVPTQAAACTAMPAVQSSPQLPPAQPETDPVTQDALVPLMDTPDTVTPPTQLDSLNAQAAMPVATCDEQQDTPDDDGDILEATTTLIGPSDLDQYEQNFEALLAQDDEKEEGATEVVTSPDELFRRENRWENADENQLPKIGSKIGPYEIITEIGRGGFGAVYQARNTKLGRDEAVKLILPSAKNECADIEKRFIREIHNVSKLEHPNIVRLYDYGALDHNILWMSMELIRGEQLGLIMDRERAMPFACAKNIMLQILAGLMDAHEIDIVHRDIKPGNIMISKRNGYPELVKILDFGLSKSIGETEDAAVQNVTTNAARSIYGTPNYMAPEQFSAQAILSPSVDVYACGVIMLELLTGVPVYTGSVIEIACAKQTPTMPIPKTMHGSAIAAVIQKACAKLPAMRYQNAAEFYNALSRINSIADRPDVLENDTNKRRNIDSETRPAHKSLTFYTTIALLICVIILIILLIIK